MMARNSLPAAWSVNGSPPTIKPRTGGEVEIDNSPRPQQPGHRYAELHCHTNYSFKEGASTISELLGRAGELGLEALAITDHNNLCGVMHFAQVAKSVGIKPIIGVELTLNNGHHITLLAENRTGYRNICQLVTAAHMDAEDRLKPMLDPTVIQSHTDGVICLSGCRNSELATLAGSGDLETARTLITRYREWFGAGNYFVELQQNLVRGDTPRNHVLASLAGQAGVGIVATNNVHYHARERFQLNDALVAVQHNSTLEETESQRRVNRQFYMKSPDQVAALFNSPVFGHYPEAITNTVRIADRCNFDITGDEIYSFPEYRDLPEGRTESQHLRALCEAAAVRKYGGVTNVVTARLDEEFRLLEKHGLCGFLLQYYDIIKIAREVQEELGLVEAGLPVDVNPPGRGRGSSVALLAGYLIGLSHIDPLKFGLRLQRFLPDTDDDQKLPPPDIDLDFPREIREQLILRVHERWGYERAVLTGMISTYRVRGAVRDLGKVLNLPSEDIDRMSKNLDGHASIGDLPAEILASPEFKNRLEAPLWKDLIRLSFQLRGFPKYLAQHPGGMILSARPLSETVPLQRSAIDGRFICQWDKFASEDAGFVKIDFLALGALSQMLEAQELIRVRNEEPLDLSRIDFDDPKVYSSIHRADTIGTFQIESAAQMQTVIRLLPENLEEMAWEVGAVRPGVGVNDGVTLLIRRHREKKADLPPSWDFDHESERSALERTYGVPLYQDQLGELAVSVAGMSAVEGERMRKAFSRPNAWRHVPAWKEKFMAGALSRGVPADAAERIYGKFHGLYQFPESHAYAFGVTVFQMQYLKVYYPLEFYVGLFNQQPMGFYNLETLKEDAGRHGIEVLQPDVNRSGKLSVIDNEKLRMGFLHVAGLQEKSAEIVLTVRDRFGPFASIAQFMERTGLKHDQLDHLSKAGAFDCFDPGYTADRRSQRWEIGLRYRPVNHQLALPLSIEQDKVTLEAETDWDRMIKQYGSLGVHPESHIMARLRSYLPTDVMPSNRLVEVEEGAPVKVAGLVIRRQRPNSKATFISLEDEFGHSPLILWQAVYQRLRRKAAAPLLIASGTMSHREGTTNVVVTNLEPIPVDDPGLKTKDWG
jgi:error-prone DNA polymerase